jgi:lipoprotein-anchoring transpeptidase ErfK/SrfK
MAFGKAVSVMAEGRTQQVRQLVQGVRFAPAVVLLLAATACSSGPNSPVAAAAGSGAGSGSSASATPAANEPVVSLTGTASKISYLKPVKLTVKDGSFTSMQVSAKSGDQELDGSVSGDGKSWVSEGPPKPSSSYQAVARVTDSAGKVQTKTVKFTVAKVPDSQRVGFTVTPGAGSTVGIGQAIHVHFLTPITKKAAIEKVMEVDATTPSGTSVVGSWHWLNSQEVHWRPKSFWTPGTKVTLNMRIAGVKASASRYGRKDYSQTFKIGASHITRVDASTDRVKVYRDGKLVDNWATGTGRRGLETYSGTYVVLGKSQVVQMDSCSARITCDKKAPDYYNEKEYWATRVTASGTFLHAASWDPLLGRANTSHGCIHLSDANAKNFYSHANVGDVVIVSHTGRGPEERIATQDPGLYDWNLSWAKWKAGSAL